MDDQLQSARGQVLAYLRGQLVGPHQEDERLREEPQVHYVMGILYPRGAESNEVVAEEEEEEEGVSEDSASTEVNENQADDPTSLANQLLPASMGVSFYLQGTPQLRLQVRAARYEEIKASSKTGGHGDFEAEPEVPRSDEGKLSNENLDTEELKEDVKQPKLKRPHRRSEWQRIAMQEPEDGWLEVESHGNRVTNVRVLRGLARVNIIWRPAADGWLTTATLINEQSRTKKGAVRPQDCLLQAELRCRPGEGGRLATYPEAKIVTDDKEEKILELLYRRHKTYGIGHGCAAAWNDPVDGATSEIWTEVFPTEEVPPLTYELAGYDRVRSLNFLAGGKNQDLPSWIHELDRFLAGYRAWIEALPAQHTDIPARLRREREVLLARLKQAAERMEAGVRLLEQDKVVRRAFQMANRAMLMQMQHSDIAFAGGRHKATEPPVPEPAPDDQRRWRAFQLAFQLLTLASVANPSDPDRTLVDLIWFPTGGGKTEAYLAVTAFVIFYRRLLYRQQGGGTAALMRYTLRLLTTQQYRRAATLICACEQIRRDFSRDLGNEPITIGLWVGLGTTPNNYENADKEYKQLLEEEKPKSPFQLDRCPWCGTELAPERKSEDLDLYGFRATSTSFAMFCPKESCPFHEELPTQVVDDGLYEHPPTLLIGTVDKFARMAWEERVGVFFGSQGQRAPDLIIQDELHLISGPLGTIVALYETALDALASKNGEKPKILASTATIRRAEEQCMALYARTVSLFPPSGLEAADSYFARYDRERAGRLYCGVLGAGHTSAITVIRAEAALLQAPLDLGLEGKAKDAWWTLVAYHNSLRELGRTLMFAVDEIPARIKVIAKDENKRRRLDGDTLAELTSHVEAADLGGMLERLERPAGEKGAIALLACTNMLSVGVDVARLGLMVVNGQPKSTSEFIQATSRVGRGEGPGLVVTIYSPTKPRDRSHYEKFASYHATLYRQVEPTSATPFAEPARERALHAVLVALMRQQGGLTDNEAARDFVAGGKELERIRKEILERVAKIDPRELSKTEQQILRLAGEWQRWAQQYEDLIYASWHPSMHVLLRDAGDGHATGWETLQSMRNVDRACAIRIE